MSASHPEPTRDRLLGSELDIRIVLDGALGRSRSFEGDALRSSVHVIEPNNVTDQRCRGVVRSGRSLTASGGWARELHSIADGNPGVVIGDVLAEGETLELEKIHPGQRLSAVIPRNSGTVTAGQGHGREGVGMTFRPTVSHLGRGLSYGTDESRLERARSGDGPYDASASDVMLAAVANLSAPGTGPS